MSNGSTLKQFGRLKYVDPTNIFLKRDEHLRPIDGTYSDAINFPYEDYNIAVDLTIRQTNRYSCGWWTEDGSMKELSYSSSNGTISFFGGTRGYGDTKNQDEGYYTTNFTDVSMMNPETNTSECLGIESIDITYNSWMYPQVVIKFVDVRGATVFQPAEKGYYNPGDLGNASAIYKSLFSFPYPMFILKVKGFYGKGVTYRLAVNKTQFEFDANTGNFNITVDFVGYMYGIYSEIPMTFLAAAPFMEGGKEYWNQKINSGEFRFLDGEGGNGTPMLTIPDLKLRLAQAAQNEAAISAAAAGEQVANSFDERLDIITQIKDDFPFNTWYKPDNIPYVYGVFPTKEDTENYMMAISGYVMTVSAYDWTNNTHFLDGMSSLKKIIDVTQSKFDGDIKEMLKYLGRIHYQPKIENKKTTYTIDPSNESKGLFKDIIEEIKGQVVYGTSPLDVYNKSVAPYVDVAEYIDKERGGLTDFYVMIFPRYGELFDQGKFLEKINEEAKEIARQKEEQTSYYKSRENSIIEKVLGFKPSIKNIYDLMFAHMDTFIHCFYDSTKIIKDQLEKDKTLRAKSSYDIKDGDTDTEREKYKSANGTEVENTNDRCKYLPPYAAYYKQTFEGTGNTSSKMVLRWPEELRNGDKLEEVKFVNNLLAATEMYFEKADNVEKMIELMNSSGSNRIDTTFTNGAPSFDVSEFIPVTTFDFVNKDRTGNPYKFAASKAYSNDRTLDGELLTTFLLRAYYYIATNSSWWGDAFTEAKSFGKLEALNVFKAVRDKYSDGFVDFIKRYADDKWKWIDNITVLESLDSNGYSGLTKTWKNDAPNLNDGLFNKQMVTSKVRIPWKFNIFTWDYEYANVKTNAFLYNFHKGFTFDEDEIEKNSIKAVAGKKYVMFPLYFDNFQTLEDYYTKGKDILKNPNMIPIDYDGVIYGGDESEVSTFYLYDGARDYIRNIYAALEDEMKKSAEEAAKMNSDYGNRDDSSYGSISDVSGILKEFKEDMKEDLNESTYVLESITSKTGQQFKADELVKLLDTATYNELQQLYIKYPSMVFDSNFNLESIFAHPLYKHQKNILAKAYLFIQTVPIFGKNRGIDASSRNGVSLKAKLLREGAYYWYQDNSNMVDFENVSVTDTSLKKTYKINYKKPNPDETLIVEYKNKVRKFFVNLFGDRDKYCAAKILVEGDKDEQYTKWDVPYGYTASRKRVLKKYFVDWATSTDDISGFAANEARLCNYMLYSRPIKQEKMSEFAKTTSGWWLWEKEHIVDYKGQSQIEKKISEGATEDDYFMGDEYRKPKYGLDIVFLAGSTKQSPEAFESRKLQDFLRNLFFSISTTFDYYNGIVDNKFGDSSGTMYAKKEHLYAAIKSFMTELSRIYGKAVTDLKENKGEFQKKMAEAQAKNPFNSTDLKLATYMSIKSLYDKWLCSPYNGPRDTWTLTRSLTGVSDFDSFKYADNFYNDIGYKLLVNVTKVSNWLSSNMPSSNMNSTEGIMGYTGRTLYEYLTEVAQDCGGILMALPQKFGLATASDVENMFTPISIKNQWDEDSSTFIFMYTYKPSEHLGDSDTSNVDMNGWSPDGDGLDLTDDDLVGKVMNSSDDSFTVPAFAVTYGKQNQSIFKNVQLSNANAGVTEVGIAATMNIAAKGSESPRESTLYGQDLYRVYSQYSYQCSVETMGNTQILPLMYFQLNNIPFWKGAYMIKKVTHKITAGNMNTTFEGIRVNRYAIPISDGAVIINKNTGDEIKDKETKPTPTDSTPTTGPDEQVPKPVDDGGNPDVKITDAIDFDESKISGKTPLICLTPAHGPKTQKKQEWEWSSKVVDRMVYIFKTEGYKYPNGEPYQVQRCNKRGAHTGKGYSMVEAKNLVSKYGSSKVVSLVPHWNGCAGQRFTALKGGTEDSIREDSVKLLECINEEAKLVKAKKDTLMIPIGMMDGKCTVEHFPSRKKTDKATGSTYISHKSSDGATMLNCACALTENWFADYPKGCAWANDEKYADTDNDGRYKTGRGWLMSDEGVDTIARLNANGIKRYIDSLS